MCGFANRRHRSWEVVVRWGHEEVGRFIVEDGTDEA